MKSSDIYLIRHPETGQIIHMSGPELAEICDEYLQRDAENHALDLSRSSSDGMIGVDD